MPGVMWIMIAGARVTAAGEDLVGIPVDAEPVTSLLDLY
jgi:hypothetical protein